MDRSCNGMNGCNRSVQHECCLRRAAGDEDMMLLSKGRGGTVMHIGCSLPILPFVPRLGCRAALEKPQGQQRVGRAQ